ncbi:putative major sperm protein (MSP) [Helianthus annuus]|nr:putative major sperm protein (MSP) [Helianthus annuus]KAJ0739822.1 putative major sperm protein (MSP) [Helianthus annuus]
MSTGDLLSIEPQELQFAFELKKQISCSMQLQNKTDDHVAFKVKTTNPKKYCVRPNSGIVFPRSTCDIIAGFWFVFDDFSDACRLWDISFIRFYFWMLRECVEIKG